MEIESIQRYTFDYVVGEIEEANDGELCYFEDVEEEYTEKQGWRCKYIRDITYLMNEVCRLQAELDKKNGMVTGIGG